MEPRNDKKLYIIMFVLIILIAVVLRSLITSKSGQLVDYEKEGIELISQGKVTYDREIYYITQDILEKYILSYTEQDTADKTYIDYYKVLNKSYKNNLGKSKYKEKAKEFFNKLEVKNNSGMATYTNIQIENIIRRIYDLGDDMYMAIVGLPDTITFGYFGIKINRTNNSYEIFYIE